MNAGLNIQPWELGLTVHLMNELNESGLLQDLWVKAIKSFLFDIALRITA